MKITCHIPVIGLVTVCMYVCKCKNVNAKYIGKSNENYIRYNLGYKYIFYNYNIIL